MRIYRFTKLARRLIGRSLVRPHSIHCQSRIFSVTRCASSSRVGVVPWAMDDALNMSRSPTCTGTITFFVPTQSCPPWSKEGTLSGMISCASPSASRCRPIHCLGPKELIHAAVREASSVNLRMAGAIDVTERISVGRSRHSCQVCAELSPGAQRLSGSSINNLRSARRCSDETASLSTTGRSCAACSSACSVLFMALSRRNPANPKFC